MYLLITKKLKIANTTKMLPSTPPSKVIIILMSITVNQFCLFFAD